jgi:hypothetical protein
MREGSITYLESLIVMETPEQNNWADDIYEEICATYVDIRNHAKDCLAGERFVSLDKLILNKLLDKVEKFESEKLI